MPRLTQADLSERNKAFESRTPQELLRWAAETFPGRVAAISALQRAGSVVCHMIGGLELDIPILFVDTGVNFPETLATRDAIGEACGLEIRTLTPPQTMDEQTAELGVLYCTPEGQKECCRLRKIEPLRAVADQFDCLIGSLRRSEGGQRSFCPILAADPDMNVVRVNPLVTFDDDSLNGYIDEHSVILNPLHEQGYPTVSCNRCTTPVLENEPRRAGRWRHLGPWQAYCGINPTDLDSDTQTAVELPQPLIDKVLGREADFMI
ncbi:MAG: phosphoadenylyl-sulfate reductase [Planctomycetota bacterium]|jgi:phosphoadenosine phosphosulfate reductase|nr:phosphoadenylyl-sulfate reductase [Planctomycetota bacterium]MED5448147.1 phosphoadenylyl-sulfate reductase [Planctomycetota bacterium]